MAAYPGPIQFAQFTVDPSNLLLVAGSNDQPAQGKVACPKTWGVTDIRLSAAGKTSQSFDDRGHGAVAAGRGGRFYFAPKHDEVTVQWTLKNPGNAGTVTLELFSAGSGVPIWRRSLADNDARKGSFDAPWDGSFPTGEWTSGDFPDDLVTVAGSPYMLKISADASAEQGFVERWTYFDVLVEKIELHWGGTANIPAGPPAGVQPNYQARTITDEQAILTTLAGNPNGDGVVPTGRRHWVRLPSNQFPQTVAEQKDDSMFAGHRDMWGDGPRIPLRAKVWIRAADDTGIHAGETAKALGQAPFLWDWESEDEIALLGTLYPKAKVRNFLRRSLDYHRNDHTGPPGSTNCHAHHGGKRGAGSVMFPAAIGTGAVTPCATRVWAATTLAELTGRDAGWTGVVFQPSRMARDTYKVSVYLASEKGLAAPLIDVVDSAAQLRANHADLPFAETDMFEIQRVVRARYIRKAPAVVAAQLNQTTVEYGRANLVLDWMPGAGDELAFHANYNTYVNRILTNTLHNEANAMQVDFKKPAADLVRGIADGLQGIDQFTGQLVGVGGAGTAPAFTVHEFNVFYEKQLIRAIRHYVCNKPRTFNGPLNQYNAWRLHNPLPADDSAWLLNFYQHHLSASKQRKITGPLRNDLVNMGMEDQQHYMGRVGTATLQGFKVLAGQQLNATADDGFVCFHCEDHVQIRRANGTLDEVPTSTGGLAPSDSTTADRKKAINLMYLMENVPPNRVGVPDVYDVSVSPIIKHEVGHNFYLVHAPAANDAPRVAGGFEAALHDAADMRCLMNYDNRSDHLCGLCLLRLRGWAAKATSGLNFVALSNASRNNRVRP